MLATRYQNIFYDLLDVFDLIYHRSLAVLLHHGFERIKQLGLGDSALEKRRLNHLQAQPAHFDERTSQVSVEREQLRRDLLCALLHYVALHEALPDEEVLPDLVVAEEGDVLEPRELGKLLLPLVQSHKVSFAVDVAGDALNTFNKDNFK